MTEKGKAEKRPNPRARRAQSARLKRAAQPKKKRSSLSKWLLRGLFGLFLAGILAALALFGWSLKAGGVPGAVVHLNVESADKGRVARTLFQAGLVHSEPLMAAYLAVLSPGLQIQVRSHVLRKGLSPRELMQRLGEQRGRPHREVTLPEGLSVLQVAERLEQNEICSAVAFRDAAKDPEVLGDLGLEGSAEGYLFPARYPLKVDSDPKKIVIRLVQEAKKRIFAAYEQAPPSEDLGRLGLSERDVVTLASVVERETGLQAERARVARVFLNRLLFPEAETRGRLQSDPTAAYGCLIAPTESPSCAAYAGRVTKEMLRDPSNRYNTYRHAGLPPGPICSPGESALRAVLSPAPGGELYFVANPRGGHTFSVTYDEHQKAVERLKQAR